MYVTASSYLCTSVKAILSCTCLSSIPQHRLSASFKGKTFFFWGTFSEPPLQPTWGKLLHLFFFVLQFACWKPLLMPSLHCIAVFYSICSFRDMCCLHSQGPVHSFVQQIETHEWGNEGVNKDKMSLIAFSHWNPSLFCASSLSRGLPDVAKLNEVFPYDPAVVHLGIYLNELPSSVHLKTFMQMCKQLYSS